MKDLFIEFLEEYNLTDSYENMFILRKKQGSSYSNIYDFLKQVNPINYISALHDWSFTKEGDEFWLDMNEKWEHKLKQQKDETNN